MLPEIVPAIVMAACRAGPSAVAPPGGSCFRYRYAEGRVLTFTEIPQLSQEFLLGLADRSGDRELPRSGQNVLVRKSSKVVYGHRVYDLKMVL